MDLGSMLYFLNSEETVVRASEYMSVGGEVSACVGDEEYRGRTFAVVTEGHLGLAEANCVFALGDAIELFQLGLVDALWSVSIVGFKGAATCTCLAREVEFNGLDADVGGSGSHDCGWLEGE